MGCTREDAVYRNSLCKELCQFSLEDLCAFLEDDLREKYRRKLAREIARRLEIREVKRRLLFEVGHPAYLAVEKRALRVRERKKLERQILESLPWDIEEEWLMDFDFLKKV